MEQNRYVALFWVFVAYLSCLAAAAVALPYLEFMHPVTQLLSVDVLATFVIFFFSLGFNNSSFYDAYWSVAPPFLFLFWMGQADTSLLMEPGPVAMVRAGLCFMLVSFWAWRLTYNWARGWTGLDHEDWRYQDFREKTGALYWPVSFLGIHLFPTLIVFAMCLPFWAIFNPTAGGFNLQLLDFLGLGLCFLGLFLETIADDQMHGAKQRGLLKPGLVFRKGLWGISRHPNYLGELLFWWGVYAVGMAASPDYWWTFVGPLSLTLLFAFVSIPMMEKRQKTRKENYTEYQKEVPALIPWKMNNRASHEQSSAGLE